MALPPEVAKRSKLLTQMGMLKPQAYKPLVYPTVTPPTPADLPVYKPGAIEERVLLAKAGLESGIAGIQRQLTELGAGNWREEENARMAEAQRMVSEVSPETIAQKEAVKWGPEGPEGLSVGGIVSNIAESVLNPAAIAGVVGGVLAKAPNPLLKAVGYSASTVANALQTGGQTAQNIEAQGGSAEEQHTGSLYGMGVGALEGISQPLIFGKISGAAGLDKAAAKQSLKLLADAGDAAAASRLATIVAEEAALKAAPPLTKIANIAKDVGRTAALGVVTEGPQEALASAGQKIAENVALEKPTWKGVEEQAGFGGMIGAFSGGVMGGGIHGAAQAVQAFKPEVPAGVVNTTGAEPGFTQEQTPFTKSGAQAARNLNLDVAAKANNAVSAVLDTAPIVSATDIGVAPTVKASVEERVATNEVAQKATSALNESLGVAAPKPPPISKKLDALLRQPAETKPVPTVSPFSKVLDTVIELGIKSDAPVGLPAADETEYQSFKTALETRGYTTTEPTIEKDEDGGDVFTARIVPLQPTTIQEPNAPITLPTAEVSAPQPSVRPVEAIPETQSVVPRTAQERLATFEANPLVRLTPIGAEEERAVRVEAGGARMQSHYEDGQHVKFVEPLMLEPIKAAIAAGREDVATVLMDQLESAYNHEDIHGALKNPNGTFTDSFNGLVGQAAVEDTAPRRFLVAGLPQIVNAKTYQNKFNKILGQPEGTQVTTEEVLGNEAARTYAMNELLAGHPRKSGTDEAQYGDYIQLRAGLLQAVGASDEQINHPIATRLSATTVQAKNALRTERAIEDRIAREGGLAEKDPATVNHMRRVAELAALIAQTLGLSPEDATKVRLAALAHDLGKEGMEGFLHNETLTSEEQAQVKEHAARTATIAAEIRLPAEIARIAAEHHTPESAGTNHPLTKIVMAADILDSLIGGPASGHEYGLKINGEPAARTMDNILSIMTEDANLGKTDPKVFEVVRDMVLSGNLPTELLNQLTENETAAQEAVVAPEAAPTEGMTVAGIDSYYVDSRGNRVERAEDAAAPMHLDLKRSNSFVDRAVLLMHTLLGGEKGLVQRVADTTYRVGASQYNLVPDGDSFKVVSTDNRAPDQDVTIEAKAGAYRIKVDDYTATKGTPSLNARADQVIKVGTRAAAAIKAGKTALGEEVVGSTAAFRGEQGVIQTTVSALRKAGAILENRANDTLNNRLLNTLAGLSYAMESIGPMVGTDINTLVIADTPEMGKITVAEAREIVGRDTQIEVKARRRAAAAQIILDKKVAPAEFEADVIALANEVAGHKKADPLFDATAWLRAELAKAKAAAKDTSGVQDFGEQDAGVDPYARTLESDEPVTELENVPGGKFTPPSTKAITPAIIINRASLPSKVVPFLNSLIAKLRILSAFTLYDSASDLSALPDFARQSVVEKPHVSRFIADDTSAEGAREHIIYIAKVNEDGSPRSAAAQAVDLAHEFGHFVQRVSLDFIVRSASISEDRASQVLVAELLGIDVNSETSRNPLLVYQNMSGLERDAVDEIFANRLAAEMLTAEQDSALSVEGRTFLDVVHAQDTKTFFEQLGQMLVAIYKTLRGVKSYAADFNSFLLAMTGRTDSIYYSVVEAGGRATTPRRQAKARVQEQVKPNMLERTSQFSKMLNSRFAKSVATGISHWYGLDSELWNMKSQTALWLARTFSGSTGDVMRKAFKDNFRKFIDFSWGSGVIDEKTGERGLGNKYSAVINGLPVYNKTILGLTYKSTPQGNAFMAEVHKWGSLQAPLFAIPDTNFVVEETVDGRKNVTLNLRDTVRKIREYYTRDLYAYQTAEGMPLKRIENYWPFDLTRENAMRFEDDLRAALAQDLVDIPVWEKDESGRDIQVLQSEKGWDEQKINDFINSYRNGTTVDRDPFASAEDEQEEIRRKALKATGKVSILGGEIAGTANNATKARKLSDARRIALMPFSEADVASMIMKRTGEAIKARATDHMWGAWTVVYGPKDYVLMTREEYKEWVKLQYSRTKDEVMRIYGRLSLLDENIENAKLNDVPRDIIKAMIAERTRVYNEAKNPELTDEASVKARAVIAKVEEALDRNYYSTFARVDAALAKGEASGDITQEQVIRIQEVLVPAMLGRLGQREISSSWRAAQAYVMTGMNVMYLPLMVLSAIAELPQIGIRMYDPILGNGMFKSQAAMLKGVGEFIVDPSGKEKTEARDMLSAIGMIKESAIESAITTSTEGEFLPAKVKQFNQRFFELTLIKRFTEFERMVAYKIGKQALMQYAQKARAGGADAAQAQAQADAVGLDVDLALQLQGDEAAWIQTKNFQDAIYNWIDEANLRPGPNTRPARMSDPRFALIWYLKDFSWAMQARTLSYLVQQARLQPPTLARLTPWIAAAVPMMIAGGMGAYARDLLTNQVPAALMGIKPYDRYKTASDVVSAAVTRSGMLGPMELIYNFGSNYEHRGLPWVSLAGPIPSLIQEAALTGSVNTAKRHIPIIAMASPPVKKAILSAMGMGPGYAQP